MTETTRSQFCDYHGEYKAKVIECLGREIVRKCPKCEAARKEREVEAERKAEMYRKQEIVARLLKHAGIPKRFHGRGFDNYRTEGQAQEVALKVTQAYADRFEDRLAHGGGLVLCGRPGTGKTHLAIAIANQIMGTGRSAVFMTVIKAVRSVKETYSRDSERSESDAIQALVMPDLLILDEVGVQFGTEAEKLILFEILNGRYEEMKPTIVISNLEEGELGEYLGDRVLDRMQEGGGAVIPFTWGSYRQQVAKDKSLPVAEVKPVQWSKVSCHRNDV